MESVEHRLFSEISKQWTGVPLRSYEVVLNHLRNKITVTGLKITASRAKVQYEKGLSFSKQQIDSLHCKYLLGMEAWNYTIKPQTNLV
ncbi:MAG: hypothetical protein OXE41_10620 [Gammaproteobacteria bacterium]|nr:hypothetical protein [Gammaproteobacteria bacterium]MCY4275827.1 hypothetical protein [Gammaproteobacteria bacterium]